MRSGRRPLVVILVLVPALLFVGVGTLWSWSEAKDRIERKVLAGRTGALADLASLLVQSTQEKMKLSLQSGIQAYVAKSSQVSESAQLPEGAVILPPVEPSEPLVLLFNELRERVHPPALEVRSFDEVKREMGLVSRRRLESALRNVRGEPLRASLLDELARSGSSEAAKVQGRYWRWQDAMAAKRAPKVEEALGLIRSPNASHLSSAQIVQVGKWALNRAAQGSDRKLAQIAFKISADHLLPRCNRVGPAAVWLGEILELAKQELPAETEATAKHLALRLDALKRLAEQGVMGPPRTLGQEISQVSLADGVGFAQGIGARASAMVLPPRVLSVGEVSEATGSSMPSLGAVQVATSEPSGTNYLSASLAPLRPSLSLYVPAATGSNQEPTDWWQLPLFLLACLLLMGLGVALMVQSQRREDALLRDRREFLATVAHQLKTPVANLRMFSETLASGDVPAGEDRSRMEAILQSESEKLGEYLERVLAVTRLDLQEDEIQASVEAIELPLLLAEAKDRFVRRATARQVAIEFDASAQGSLPLIMADPRAVGDAVHNVLDNAIRLTKEGSAVTITAKQEGSSLVVRIADQGPGIPIEQRERVFDAYYRGRSQDTRSGQGTGLGLAIAQHAMMACGGNLAIESTSPRGTTIRFDFPVRSS